MSAAIHAIGFDKQIPVNPIKERDFKQSNLADINKFKNKLEKNRINVTIRREMGRDIDGACGQLRKRYSEEHLEEQVWYKHML